jgi:predicted RNase H-like HicB family nuclease
LKTGPSNIEIRLIQGVWANADTLEACREELREVLEEWIILGLKMGHHIPVIKLYVKLKSWYLSIMRC